MIRESGALLFHGSTAILDYDLLWCFTRFHSLSHIASLSKRMISQNTKNDHFKHPRCTPPHLHFSHFLKVGFQVVYNALSASLEETVPDQENRHEYIGARSCEIHHLDKTKLEVNGKQLPGTDAIRTKAWPRN